MKRLSIVLIVSICATSFAQGHQDVKRENRKELKNEKQNLTPEQHAELVSKKMTLALDLTEGQQREVQKLALEKAKDRKELQEKRKAKKEFSETERFESKVARLDRKIAYKKEMKSILNEDQYKKWERGKDAQKREKRKGHKKGRPSEKH